MCIRAYIAASCVNHMTRLHIGQVVLEGPEWLCDFLLLLLFCCFLVRFGFWCSEWIFLFLGFFGGVCFWVGL